MTTPPGEPGRADASRLAARLRLIGLVLLAVPIVILLVFTVGELAGGDITGLQHVLQAAPLAALAWGAWRWPYQGGQILMVVGAVLSLVFLFALHPPGLDLLSLALVEVVLFLPAIVAGALLTISGAISRGGSRAP